MLFRSPNQNARNGSLVRRLSFSSVADPDGRRIDHTVGIKRDYPHDFFLIQASILHCSRHSIALSIVRSLPQNPSSLRLPGIPIDFSNQDRQSLRQETLVPDLGLQQPRLNRFVDFGPVLSGEDTGRTAGDFGDLLYCLDCNASSRFIAAKTYRLATAIESSIWRSPFLLCFSLIPR